MILNAYHVSDIPIVGSLTVLLLVYLVGSSFWTRYKPGLRSLPGPFIASFTNLWRLVNVARGHHYDTLLGLHRKYRSNLVRIGPNAVSVSDPDAVRIIYGLKSGFQKVRAQVQKKELLSSVAT